MLTETLLLTCQADGKVCSLFISLCKGFSQQSRVASTHLHHLHLYLCLCLCTAGLFLMDVV